MRYLLTTSSTLKMYRRTDFLHYIIIVYTSHRGCPKGRLSTHSSFIWSCLLNWSNMASSTSPPCTPLHVTSHDHMNHTHSPETVPQLVLSIHWSPAQHLVSGRQMRVCHEDVANNHTHLLTVLYRTYCIIICLQVSHSLALSTQ